MILDFNHSLAHGYKSPSQVARVLTEDWVNTNIYCPKCGVHLTAYENNRPVADFFCPDCAKQFELKSKNARSIGKTVADGAYDTMVQRIASENNPHFFFMSYDKSKWQVRNFCIIPKYYFTPDIIIKRKPLSQNAKRAGWVGCNIDISKVPSSGKIYYVKDACVTPQQDVCEKWNLTHFLEVKKGEAKGWLLDIMRCIDLIPHNTFSLNDVYAFELDLKKKYPDNHFIKDKIRQQLQFLRNKGMITFLKRGVYQKV